MTVPTRRKVFPDDIYTVMAAGGTFFLLAALGVVLYYLDIHYGYLGLFVA